MNRDVILLYLKEIRDLEMAKHKLDTVVYNQKQEYSQKFNSYVFDDYKDVSDLESSSSSNEIWSIFGLILTVILLVIALFIDREGGFLASLVSGFFFIIAIIFGIITFSMFASASTEKEKVSTYKKYNEEQMLKHALAEEARNDIQNEWNDLVSYYEVEYSKIEHLLNAYYSMNILANPYRNLASVYYIYDYMSSSNASLEETLFHEHMENGIQRILSKLDTIISQNNTIILQNRQIEATSKEILRVNTNMLEKLQAIETNTETASQYAELASNYAAANAFFSAAQYLK